MYVYYMHMLCYECKFVNVFNFFSYSFSFFSSVTFSDQITHNLKLSIPMIF